MIVEPTLLDHPKFLKLARRVGEGRALTMLIRLWGHCQAECRREFWAGADAEYIEAVARWDGDNGVAYEALKATGFVLEEDGGVRIHDWDEMNASMLKRWDNGKKRGSPDRRTVPGEPTPHANGGSVNRKSGFGEPNPPENGSSLNRKAVLGSLRGDERRGEDTPLPPEGDEAGEQPPSEAGSESGPEAQEAGQPEPPGTDRSEIEAAERVWAVWPKRMHTLAALVAIREAIRRDGLARVLEGTRLICEADRRRGVSPPGRFLPNPVEFFEQSRYLDDPAQYGPREGGGPGAGAVPLGIRVRELASQLDAHPGSPLRQDPEPAQARDWWRLYREVQQARVELVDAEDEPLAVRITQGKALLELHVGNPDNGLGSASSKEAAAAEYRDARRKVKALRERMRGSNGEGKNHE